MGEYPSKVKTKITSSLLVKYRIAAIELRSR